MKPAEETALAEAAIEWAATLDDQPDDPVIRRRFLAWLHADPAHAAAWAEAERAWAAAADQGAAAPPRHRGRRWLLPAVVAGLIALAAALMLA